MAQSYYSLVLDHPADDVWAVIESETVAEAGKRGDQVSAMRVAPMAEANKSFVEWRATFDCAAEERDRWTRHFEREGFATWLDALRRFMAKSKAA